MYYIFFLLVCNVFLYKFFYVYSILAHTISFLSFFYNSVTLRLFLTRILENECLKMNMDNMPCRGMKENRETKASGAEIVMQSLHQLRQLARIYLSFNGPCNRCSVSL